MNNTLNKFAGIIALIALAIGVIGCSLPVAQDINAALGAFDIPTRFPNGHLDTNGGYYVDGTAIIDGSGALSATTGTFSSTLGATGALTADGGLISSYTKSTTTYSTAMVLKAADILNYTTVIVSPYTSALTYTFPASSTLSTLVPVAGDSFEQCWINATTTAAATLTFAAGTGIDLKVASSTGSTGGDMDLTVAAGDMACLKYVRKAATASAFDIIVGVTEFVSAD